MVHGSTFSGIGAPEIAAEMLGWENSFHCEINPFGRKVLDYYFPKAESYEDITKTDFSKWRGKIDVLTGGFPCQPFSYAGKRRGSEDDRYLWPYMLKCIQQIRPTWFIGENVAGITTMVFPGKDVKVGEDASLFGKSDRMERRERYVIEEICQQLEEIGYSVQPMLIPACAVGAPHRRDRVFFIAHRDASDTDGIGGQTEDIRRESQEQGTDSQDNEQPKSVLNQGSRVSTEYKNGRSTSDAGSRGRREICEPLQSKLADGTKSISNGWKPNASDTDSTRQSAPECESGRERQAMDRERKSQSLNGTERPCTEKLIAETYNVKNSLRIRRLQRDAQEQGSERNIGDTCSRSTEWVCSKERTRYIIPENRWRAFPTVSPVYRGNDGLPFNVDNLTIPFYQWRRESLKAYGNAIVVQVMYRIFEAIDKITKSEQLNCSVFSPEPDYEDE